MKKQITDDYDNKSEASDCSVFTDVKVFKGAIGKIAKINKNISDSDNNHNKKIVPIKSNIQPFQTLKIENEIQQINDMNFNLNINLNLENEKDFNSNRKVNSPLSFRPNILEEIEKFNLETPVEIKEEEENPSDEEIYVNSKKNFFNKKSDSQNKFESFEEIVSNAFRENYDKNSGDDRLEENVFWNLKENNNSNAVLLSNKNLSFQNSRMNSLNSKFDYKTNDSSFVSCTLSKIDRGSAVLVTNDDVVFTMPVCLLPKNLEVGSSYQIKIDYTSDIQKKLSSMQLLQKKLMKSNK